MAVRSAPIAWHVPLRRIPVGDRPDVVLRLSVIVLVALTAAVALVPGVHAHLAAPAVDLALDTTAAVVSISLTALAWVRFTERRETVALFHAAAFLALATAYGVAVAVSVGRDGTTGSLADPMTQQAWVFAAARLIAAVLLILGGTAFRGRAQVRHSGGVAVIAGLAVLVVAIVGYGAADQMAVLALLTADAPPGALPMTTRLGVVVQLITATLFFAAAWVTRSGWRRDRVVMDAWIAVALVFAGFAEIHWMLYPSGHPGHVASADLLRLACFIALLLGIEAEARLTLIRLRTANAELAELRDLEVDRAAIEERSRLARELHDGLAQDLWLAKLKALQAAGVPGLPRRAVPLIADAVAAIDSGLTEARQAVLALRMTTDRDRGFCDLLLRFVEDFEDRFGLRTEYACLGDSARVSPRTQAEVLRIAQEALTNARQHGEATVVGVRLEIEADGVTLRVADNGRGFDPDAVTARGFGLSSMHERAALIGGRLYIESRPGEGTTIVLLALLEVPRAAAIAAGASG